MKQIAIVIFWRLHSAFLKNDRDKARMFLAMFQDEVKQDSINDILGVHTERYEWIRQSIENNSFSRFHGGGYEMPDQYPIALPDNKKESEFNTLVVRDRNKLYKCLGIENKASILREFDLGEYGRADFVIFEGRKRHCVESKIEEATFAILGQVDKYRIALELDLCLGMYDYVEAVVLARSFSPYVAAELSRNCIKMVVHDGTLDNLRWINKNGP